MNWQGMDTAPRDGTAVLLHGLPEYNTGPVADFSHGTPSHIMVGAWAEEMQAWFIAQGQIEDGSMRAVCYTDEHFTHWKSLQPMAEDHGFH